MYRLLGTAGIIEWIPVTRKWMAWNSCPASPKVHPLKINPYIQRRNFLHLERLDSDVPYHGSKTGRLVRIRSTSHGVSGLRSAPHVDCI